ncbi:Glutathione S-transferase 1-1 [Armadillidium vulgare]|nr:Glutathione S-transferase 1-1 [Armadillidium vulgare]
MIDLYYFEYSAPCRAVMLCAKALGIPLNKIRLNLPKREQLNPDFVAINPQHCVPTLVDGDLALWDSHAICTYLASQYGKDDTFYPKCPKKRAAVDKLLYFEVGVLYKRFREYFPVTTFCVGNNLTVADFSLVATISSIFELGIDMSNYPNIIEWFERCKTEMPGYETENEGVKPYAVFLKSKMAEAQS